MKLKKPKFWDYKKPSFLAYILLPFTYLFILINHLRRKKKVIPNGIKSICVGNIYLGGTGKTPISLKLNKILCNLNFKTAFIKKKYENQIDEQKLLSSNGILFCEKNRILALKKAIIDNIQIAIFDDGLQDRNLDYNLTFVCFNINNWIGNGLLIPSGPLRENLHNVKKYDAIFLNGNGENTLDIISTLKNINPNLEIFESKFIALNVGDFNLDKNYLAFSGIGAPQSFLKTLKENKFNIVKNLDYPDHYSYKNNDIVEIKNLAKKLNAEIITTEKDYVRLNKLNSEGIRFLKVELKISNEEKLINFLNKKL